jgi:hypothetical protein
MKGVLSRCDDHRVCPHRSALFLDFDVISKVTRYRAERERSFIDNQETTDGR